MRHLRLGFSLSGGLLGPQHARLAILLRALAIGCFPGRLLLHGLHAVRLVSRLPLATLRQRRSSAGSVPAFLETCFSEKKSPTVNSCVGLLGIPQSFTRSCSLDRPEEPRGRGSQARTSSCSATTLAPIQRRAVSSGPGRSFKATASLRTGLGTWTFLTRAGTRLLFGAFQLSSRPFRSFLSTRPEKLGRTLPFAEPTRASA